MDDLGTDHNAPPSPGRPSYDQSTRDLAYRVWLMDASQSPARTARILARDHGIPLSDETIRYWRDTEDWPGRIADAVRQVGRGQSVQAFLDLVAGGPQSIAFLRTLVDGDFPESETIAGLGLRLKAAIALKDSAGYSPLGRSSTPQLPADHGDDTKALPDLAGKSADELEAIERAYLDGRK
jgi:hypothetical protein